MRIAFVVALVLGFFSVLQGGLNRRIASEIDLGRATLLNGLVFVLVAFVGWQIGSRLQWFQGSSGFPFKWWWLIPGTLGAALVLGIPFSIQRIGAVRTFVALIAAQIVFSALWDQLVEHQPVTSLRLIGGGLAILAALCTALG